MKVKYREYLKINCISLCISDLVLLFSLNCSVAIAFLMCSFCGGH